MQERLNRFTHCLRLTRSTEVRRKSASNNSSQIPSVSLSLFFLRVSPKARAPATISSLRHFFALLAITCRSSVSLPSLWANTLALGSCLCDNRSKTRQRQAVVLSSIPPYKPPRKPCVLRVLCVSASLLRTFSHHVLAHAKRLEVASPHSSTTCKGETIFYTRSGAFEMFYLTLYPFGCKLFTKKQNYHRKGIK